jgi:hypothetical protein
MAASRSASRSSQFVSTYTLDYTSQLSGVPKDKLLEALARLYADPKTKVMSLLDHGLQPAHARHLGQQHDLQRPPAGGQDQRARQQPVQPDRPAQRLRHRARVGTFATACRPTWW